MSNRLSTCALLPGDADVIDSNTTNNNSDSTTISANTNTSSTGSTGQYTTAAATGTATAATTAYNTAAAYNAAATVAQHTPAAAYSGTTGTAATATSAGAAANRNSSGSGNGSNVQYPGPHVFIAAGNALICNALQCNTRSSALVHLLKRIVLHKFLWYTVSMYLVSRNCNFCVASLNLHKLLLQRCTEYHCYSY
jgi:peptidoglycan DL-endopeptidase CwlO